VTATFDESTTTLILDHDLLVELARLQAGVDPLSHASGALVAAGLVGPDGVHELAGELARTAVAPLRATVVERFDGTRLAPVFVGWTPDGGATITGVDASGRAQVSGLEISGLPSLLSRWTGLDTAVDRDGRAPVRTSTRVLDVLVADPSAVDDPALAGIVEAWVVGWRASGSWGEAAVDRGLTVVDTGALGLWRVEHPPRTGDEVVDAVLVPITVAEARAALGDVVTGRRSPSPERTDA
jgi:hypothetical protein